MPRKPKTCFSCESDQGISIMFGYPICEKCESKMGLFKDNTIKRQAADYRKNKKRTYEEEIDYRLDFIEKDYIRKKIKLLYIQERLKHI